jgi:hypothetical protein
LGRLRDVAMEMKELRLLEPVELGVLDFVRLT